MYDDAESGDLANEGTRWPIDSPKFLDGIHILTVAQNVPGPLAVAQARRAGARVVKIEPPGGDRLATLSPRWYAELHAGITVERLDLKIDSAQSRLTALLAEADLLLTSQRPSQLARLGLDRATLRSRAPRVRVLGIVGSLRDPERVGHDLTYQAEAGLVGDTMPLTLAADVMASERAFTGMLALLRQPSGSAIDVGLVESLEPLLAPLRFGLTTPNGALGGAAPQYRVYAAKAGRVAVAALEPQFEAKLYRELGLVPGSDLSEHFRERTATEWDAWARERDLPIAAVREL
jgi:crotonobetainyl-CoA:carnitine CoA-transferase CaiB-like acyl-CoA transferase